MESEKCETRISRNAEAASPDLPDLQANYIEKSYLEKNRLSLSQDSDAELCEILQKSELPLFSPELAGLFEHAITRLYYSDNLRVNEALLPQRVIRRTLHALDGSILQTVEQRLHGNTERRVRKGLAYTCLLYTSRCV